MPEQITVVIPAYNETTRVGGVIAELRALDADWLAEILVVDDGSEDGTGEAARAAGARVLTHRHNRGYGAALKTGLLEAKTKYVLTMDADGQHRAAEAARLAAEVGSYDMLVGQRPRGLHSPAWRMPGKWFLGILANHLMRRRIPDLNSGLRLIRRSVARRYFHLCPAGFSFSTTLTLALISRGYDVDYIPINVEPRTGQSTVSLRTGLDTIILILRIAALFEPLRLFVPASLLIGLAGFLWAIPFALLGRGISIAAMLAMVTGVILFALGILCDQISQLRLERYE